MKNNKKSISTKIKAFVFGAILVGVVAVTTVFSLTGCNTNTQNNPPTLSQPGDFDDNQNNNNQTNNNQNNNNQNNNNENNQNNNNQNNNQTQQKTEAQKLKEAFDAFNIAVKEKVAAITKTTPENVEINYITLDGGKLVVGAETETLNAEYKFQVDINSLNLEELTSKVKNTNLLKLIMDTPAAVSGYESDVEDALRDAGYIKSSDKVLSLSCSDVASAGALDYEGNKIYYSFVNLVVLNANGKAQTTKIEMRYAGIDVFGNLDDAKFVEWDSENLNDAAVVYEMMKSGNFQGALDYM